MPHPANIALVIHKRKMQNDGNIADGEHKLDLDDAALGSILNRLTNKDSISTEIEYYSDEEKEEAGGSVAGWSDATERPSPSPNEYV